MSGPHAPHCPTKRNLILRYEARISTRSTIYTAVACCHTGGMITVKQLTKKYGAKTAIKDLTFQVPDGAVTGFLGPNGSGKSTSMRCILGLDKPSSGQAFVDGTEFSRVRNKPAQVGALLEATWFNPGRSGRAHLRVLAYGAGISAARVDECLELVGLSGAANKKIGGYSLGMKQRLGLAGALLGDPKHLILDEPVNGLDPEGVSWMRHTIRHLASEGRAVLVSSHLLSEMEQTADRLVVIGRGEMIGEYSMEEFLRGGTKVVVEAGGEDVDKLTQRLQSAGLDVSTRDAGVLALEVPENTEEIEIRRLVGKLSAEHQIPIIGLRTESQNLEQRFLTATADAQEYSTRKGA